MTCEHVTPREHFAWHLDNEAGDTCGAMKAKGFHEGADRLRSIVESAVDGDGFEIPDRAEVLKYLDVEFCLHQHALMNTEISEMSEAVRKPGESTHIPGFTGEEEEVADILIRVLHYAGRRKLRIGAAYIAKTEFNARRPHKHGKLA